MHEISEKEYLRPYIKFLESAFTKLTYIVHCYISHQLITPGKARSLMCFDQVLKLLSMFIERYCKEEILLWLNVH